MWYIGLDVHQRMSCICCILDENGKVIKEQQILSGWDGLIGTLRKVPERSAICYEASRGYGYHRCEHVAQGGLRPQPNGECGVRSAE